MDGYDSHSGFVSEFCSRGDYTTPSGKTQEGKIQVQGGHMLN